MWIEGCEPYPSHPHKVALSAALVHDFRHKDAPAPQLNCLHARLMRDLRRCAYSPGVLLRDVASQRVCARAFAFILSVGNVPFLRNVLEGLVHCHISGLVQKGENDLEFVCRCRLYYNRDARLIYSAVWCHTVADGLAQVAADRRLATRECEVSQQATMTTERLPRAWRAGVDPTFAGGSYMKAPSVSLCKRKRTRLNTSMIHLLDHVYRTRRCRVKDARVTWDVRLLSYYQWTLSVYQTLFLLEIAQDSYEESFMEWKLFAGPMLDTWFAGELSP